jgi:CheY-like chemotaxis protein
VVSRILLVESDVLVSTVAFEALLGELQTEVQCAWSGKQAIKMISAARFDFAFVSIMKDRSGIAVAEYAANENIPVLLTSGHPATQTELKRLGYPYLAKPYSIPALLVLVSQTMQEHAANILCVKASATKS